MSIAEAACAYASLILHDDGIAVTAEKIAALLKASNVSVESYWPSLFAKLCEKRNVEDLIVNIGAGGGAAVAVAAPSVGASGGAAPAAPATEEKKEETKEEESDDDMGFSLFD
ncbi:60S acidic ribosomal protein P1-like [Andrographis paniculata]|uniref:60S acidic ribosomal protein P1-like n=1 Tax=Andrographis paniculata TaxID=175694 RepID=UPI0021E903D4|nr:60S acidic ribosomal protein P1-like [Andrographis paniculata]